jgi:hypothetical protein
MSDQGRVSALLMVPWRKSYGDSATSSYIVSVHQRLLVSLLLLGKHNR